MSTLDSITAGLKELLEAAKDLPTEKVATVGLILLGTGAILKDLASGNAAEAIEKAKGIIEVLRRFVWNLTARIHRSGARWGLRTTRQSELSTNPPGGAFC